MPAGRARDGGEGGDQGLEAILHNVLLHSITMYVKPSFLVSFPNVGSRAGSGRPSRPSRSRTAPRRSPRARARARSRATSPGRTAARPTRSRQRRPPTGSAPLLRGASRPLKLIPTLRFQHFLRQQTHERWTNLAAGTVSGFQSGAVKNGARTKVPKIQSVVVLLKFVAYSRIF